MDRALVLFAIGLVFGGGIGFAIAAGNGITFDGHDHGDASAHAAAATDGQESSEHEKLHQRMLEISAVDAPEVSLLLNEDPLSGYNLQIKTRNFEFAPAEAGLQNAEGRGHAHVHVNGTRIARLYGPWLHIPALPEGEALIEVTLTANDHRTLAVAGNPISASVMEIVQ
ncbi:hypothetical protein ACFSUD_17685 [Sulfitobacter aestuarii]|uniref:Copper chaperone PCu(A)C n=1 Tax=Sulfitobacter aestuarii TaxID=2161676 RepID=A0ABW5U6H4_9RHOB